jgi:hypothetical protein
MKKNLKLLILVMAIAFITATTSSIKGQAFQNGDMVANLGFGFGWYGYGYGATSLPAISLSIEKGIKDIDNVGPLSIGGIIGYKRATYAWTSVYDWTWNDIIVAARGAIHYDLLKNDKIDTYGGVALGLRFQSYTDYNILGEKGSSTSIHPLFALYLGGRYFFTDNLGGFAELGYGLGYLTLGLSYKF